MFGFFRVVPNIFQTDLAFGPLGLTDVLSPMRLKVLGLILRTSKPTKFDTVCSACKKEIDIINNMNLNKLRKGFILIFMPLHLYSTIKYSDLYSKVDPTIAVQVLPTTPIPILLSLISNSLGLLSSLFHHVS